MKAWIAVILVGCGTDGPTSIEFRFNGSSASFYDPAIIALDHFNVY